MKSRKLYIISGERSGDLHASNLVRSLFEINSNLNIRGMGGSYSKDAGVDIAVDYAEVALMGFLEVALGFRKVLKYLKLVKNDILSFSPDAIILVDYGGFNMKIASFATKNDIPVHYYIPPKVWAWNQKRALKLKAYTDHIYSILPFEPIFFEKYDLKIHYVGNPLLDEISKFSPHEFFFQKNELSYQPIIALLPGSRAQEINAMLVRMVELVKEFPNAQFVIAGVGDLGSAIYQRGIDAGIRVIFDQTYDLLSHSIAAVVTSGTATLEAALFRVPQIVVYRTSSISYAIAKNLIRVPYISLVNLIADKEVVKELIQDDFSVLNLKTELKQILGNQVYKGHMLQGYDLIKERLGEQSASETTARLILNSLNQK
ncbi:lipid-A-disaccharide synthase [Algoriphagus yeomjeoni]|uniref:Lipid-A-disaccharide synthase n=1 Tax=Algoriphagus yeomjeoni TaxID=291403 RepID=A0A327PDB5_9BACT|nr:lipid-A-disaccharide synthase [Algoriphagus yeomjeoni]RAI90250.1 lipid-A-disaccharide synthase [Algoriphagus yeomjeoni]